jgi:cellobiose phosphorylase
MEFGHFSEDGREFIITGPDTPKPWVNCLTNGSYSALVSQSGGGYSFINGPGYDRITRANPDTITTDRPGRYVFVRDNSTGEFFSIGWQPVMRKFDSFECRHTHGVTTISSSCLGIAGQMVIFVPMDDNLEVWRVTLENKRDESADLSVFTYVEWVLGNYSDDLAQRQSSVRFNQVRFEDNYILATKRMWRRPETANVHREVRPGSPEIIGSNQAWGKYAFIAATVPVDSFDCDREAFIGR